MNIGKVTFMIESLYPELMKEVQPEVRVAALEALLAIEKGFQQQVFLENLIIEKFNEES